MCEEPLSADVDEPGRQQQPVDLDAAYAAAVADNPAFPYEDAAERDAARARRDRAKRIVQLHRAVAAQPETAAEQADREKWFDGPFEDEH